MGLDIELDTYGRGIGKYITWTYLPHEDTYWHPTVDGRNAALIVKSGVVDGPADSFKRMEEAVIGTPIANIHDPVEVGHVARSYDSYLVCTVHAHDAKTGAELARFRTA